MKKYIYIIVFIITFGLFSSCEDLLRIKPENLVTFNTGFDTERGIAMALNGTEMLAKFMEGQSSLYPAISGEISDFRRDISYDMLHPSMVPNTDWMSYYQVIMSANVTLPYIDKINMSQERKDFYRGQIYFFKAYAYLYLIRKWGDVPLIKDEESHKAPIARTYWTEVADYAIGLAENAVRLLPEFKDAKDYLGNSIQYKSTPARGAANAVLAHLNAWKAGCKYLADASHRSYDETKYWQATESACTAVIGSETGISTGNYSLAQNPEELCTKVLVGFSDESIYEHIIIGFPKEMPEMSGPLVLGDKFQDYPLKTSNMGNTQYMDYRILNETVRKIYPDNNDGRREAFFYHFSELADDPESQGITGGYSFPNKWRQAMMNQDHGEFERLDINPVIFRLADMYLLRAEARARLGKNDLAINDLNTIRRRAGANDYDATIDVGNLNYVIFKEREKEFLFEGIRYFDVVRNGYVNRELQGGFLTATEQDFIDGALYLAVHFNNFIDNPLMRQTPYWAKRER